MGAKEHLSEHDVVVLMHVLARLQETIDTAVLGVSTVLAASISAGKTEERSLEVLGSAAVHALAQIVADAFTIAAMNDMPAGDVMQVYNNQRDNYRDLLQDEAVQQRSDKEAMTEALIIATQILPGLSSHLRDVLMHGYTPEPEPEPEQPPLDDANAFDAWLTNANRVLND